jgi:single-strand DNA-binding protein
MGSVNKVILVGRLGADVDLKYTNNGRPVANLSVATSEVWKDKQSGEKKEKTEWSRVQVWGDLAENCAKFLAKGRQVYVEGKLQTREWEDKNGQKRFTTEVVASQVVFLGSADGGGSTGEATGDKKPQHREERAGWGSQNQPDPDPTNGNDDLPF